MHGYYVLVWAEIKEAASLQQWYPIAYKKWKTVRLYSPYPQEKGMVFANDTYTTRI